MNETDKQLMRLHRPFIVQNLADVGAVCDNLIALDVLTESMVDDIMSKDSNAGKTRALLNLLVMRGPEAFNSFHQALIITKNLTVANMLKPPKVTKLKFQGSHDLGSLSKPNRKITRAESLPSPETHPLYSGDFQQRPFKSYVPRQDDNKTEYGEYDEYEMYQGNETESKQVHGGVQVSEIDQSKQAYGGAQVSNQDESTSMLVASSQQSVGDYISEAFSQRDIHRDMTDTQTSGNGYPISNIHQSLARLGNAPSDTILPGKSLGNSQVQLEQEHDVTRNKEHGDNLGTQVSSQSEDEAGLGYMSWPRSKKHSRPLVHFTIKKPANWTQLSLDIVNDRVYNFEPKLQRLVIINNSTFLPTSGLSPRSTGDIDATSLDLLFKKLNYSTKTYSDCSTKRMMEVVKDESTGERLGDVDTFVLIILSHGDGEKVYGTDGETINIRDITQLFGETHCPALSGKPKLFFISASKPQRMSSGDDSAQSGLEGMEYDNLSLNTLNSLISTTTAAEGTEPCDMFVARATSQCNAVYEGVSFGSQFIQAFIHVIKELSSTDDLITLMEKMNQLVERPTGNPLVEYTNTLRKKFYFFDPTIKHSLLMSI